MRKTFGPSPYVFITREDAEDLQVFVYAITEYVYDLAERYDEFKERQEKRAKNKRSATSVWGDDEEVA